VRLLERIRTNFLTQAERIPLPLEARDRSELQELSEATELDAMLRCAVHDHLDPLLESLWAVSRKPLKASRGRGFSA
jgi:hypothetical protein